jgi:SAM-dependent methyltransferase
MDLSLPPSTIPEFYDRVFPGVQDGELELYRAAFSPQSDARCVLDLGCGTCRLHPVFAQLLPEALIVSCDLGADWLRLATARGESNLVCGDARALPFADDAFGAISSGLLVVNYLATADDFVAALREVARILTPGGIFVADMLCAHRPRALQGIRESFAPDDASEASFAFEFYDVLSEDARGATLASAMILGADGEMATDRANVFVPALGALLRMLEEAGLKLEWFAPPYDFEDRTMQPPEDCLRAVICVRR